MSKRYDIPNSHENTIGKRANTHTHTHTHSEREREREDNFTRSVLQRCCPVDVHVSVVVIRPTEH